MATHYDWVIELIDRTNPADPSIVEVNHADTYAEALQYVGEPAGDFDVGLVRDWDCNRTGAHSRAWAYVTADGLPEWLTDADGVKVARVPARFRAQFDKAAAQ
jgi:hypothetical protein